MRKDKPAEPKSIGNCQCGLPLNKHHDREGELWLACPKHGRLTEESAEHPPESLDPELDVKKYAKTDVEAVDLTALKSVPVDIKEDLQTAPAKPEPSLRRDMEDLVRIANRHGFFLEGHLSDGHRILRRSDGESLELLLEEA